MDESLVYSGPSTRGWHRLEAALRCPYLAKPVEKLTSTSGLTRYEPKALTTKGSLMHFALAQYFRRQQARQQGTDPALWMDPFSAIAVCAEREAKLDEEAGYDSDIWYDYVPLIQDCFTYWKETYAETGPMFWRILGVETELRCRVTPDGKMMKTSRDDLGYLYTQRADLIIEINKRVYIVDHKTTSRRLKRIAQGQALNGQFLGYRELGKLYAKERWGDVLIHSLFMNDTKEFEFDYGPAPDAYVSDFGKTIVYAEKIRERGEATGYWPKAYSQFNCSTRYGLCPKFSECRGC